MLWQSGTSKKSHHSRELQCWIIAVVGGGGTATAPVGSGLLSPHHPHLPGLPWSWRKLGDLNTMSYGREGKEYFWAHNNSGHQPHFWLICILRKLKSKLIFTLLLLKSFRFESNHAALSSLALYRRELSTSGENKYSLHWVLRPTSVTGIKVAKPNRGC